MRVQRSVKTLFLLLFFPFYLSAQQSTTSIDDITGLWKGSLYNDTTQKNLPYELAISEVDGKLTGYSYTLFDIDGKKEMGVKKIKLTRAANEIVIEDVELISNNYSEPPPRKVRQKSVLQILQKDTTMELAGKWSTNRTREYNPLTGSLQLERKADYKPETLFKILAALKLENSLSFVRRDNEQWSARKLPQLALTKLELSPSQSHDPDKAGNAADLVAPASVAAISIIETPAKLFSPADDPVEEARVFAKLIWVPVTKKSGELIARNPARIKKPAIKNIVAKDVFKPLPVVEEAEKKNEVAVVPRQNRQVVGIPPAQKPAVLVTAPAVKKTEPVTTAQATAGKEGKAPAAISPTKEVVKTAPVVVIAPGPEQKNAPAPAASAAPVAANVSERTMKKEQSVYFESDSLVLTLYDNGEVDGDTVSVLMNGQVIFARQGLSTKANSKTIYIEKGLSDSLSMVMYAENLGSIPPNTGLLIIMDGENRYEVRFSADLKTNAAILLRRRKTDH